MMSNGIFTPILQSTDWNAEWQRLQEARRKSDSAEYWDSRAKTFPVKHGSHRPYVSRFLELADIQPGETVFDMGCGTGALATPLAQMGHHVIACDFSRGMLDVMEDDQRNLGVEGVETHVMSWDDDWSQHGFEPNAVDVALASRSIATSDLQQALFKLNDIARRRVCITLPCGPSPRVDNDLLRACGFPEKIGHDFLYAFLILANAGFKPEVAYIRNTRAECFETRDDAFSKLYDIVVESVKGTVEESELAAVPAKLNAWLDDNLLETDKGFQLKNEREVIWAFIAWETV